MLIKTPSTQSPVWFGSKPTETVVSFRAAQKLDIIKHIRCKAATAGRESKSPLKTYGIIHMAATKRQVFKAVKKRAETQDRHAEGKGLPRKGTGALLSVWYQDVISTDTLEEADRQNLRVLHQPTEHKLQPLQPAQQRDHICGMTLQSGLITWPLALTLLPSYQG